MNSKRFKSLVKKKAFTLAEVLITLGIIGVVAALTMPSIITYVKNVELESRFKKSYNELSNALQKASADQGETIYGNYSGISTPSLEDILIAQFNNQAEALPYGSRIQYKKYDGTDFYLRYLDDGTIYVNGGFYIYINNDCNIPTLIQFIIDTNGAKKPNKEGYDLFMFCLNSQDKLSYDCNTYPTQYTKKAVSDKDYFKNLP